MDDHHLGAPQRVLTSHYSATRQDRAPSRGHGIRLRAVLTEGTGRYFAVARRRPVALIKYSCMSSKGSPLASVNPCPIRLLPRRCPVVERDLNSSSTHRCVLDW